MSGTTENIFDLDTVSGGYGKRTIIKDITLSIAPGNFIAVIGPNGAGKSTLVKLLTGDLPRTGGIIRFRGEDRDRYAGLELARKLSVVHQFTENILPFTVHRFIRLGRFPHQKPWEIETPADREIIEEAMATTGVSGLRDRLLTELSGGELQLVFITRALVQNREVIILDEPISHLDLRHSMDIMDILHGLNRDGATIITVLHDMNIASDYCNRIIALKEGAVFFDGSPGEVLRYDLVEELFNVVSIVRENPLSGRPYVYPVPLHVQKK